MNGVSLVSELAIRMQRTAASTRPAILRSLMKHRTLVTLAISSVAHADTFDFSFSGILFSGSGTFTATEEGATNLYDVTGVTGTVRDWAGSSNISSLIGLNNFNGNDNKLIFPGIALPFFLPTKFFDTNGVSFALADGDVINLNDSWGSEYAVIGAPKGLALPEVATIGITKNSPVPEPSSLALFGTGILGIAGAMRLKLRFG
jgi:PEP-CTERM motif